MKKDVIYKWKYVYFGLALLDVVAVGTSLLINHRLGSQFSEAVQVNQLWATRIKTTDRLQALASEVNSPGNDIFESHDVKKERARFLEAVRNYSQTYKEAFDDLRSYSRQHPIEKVLKSYEEIQLAMSEMVDETSLIFSHFERKQSVLAARRMATMDQKYAKVRRALIDCNQNLRELQINALEKQKEIGEDLRQFEILFAVFIATMIAGVLIYGTMMSRFVTKAFSNKKLMDEQKKALDASAIVAITDTQGKITYVNEKFAEITGYQEVELLGKDHRIINSGYHTNDFFRALWKTISAGEIWRGEVKNRRKDGSHYWVDSTIVPMKDEFDRITQYIAIRHEITGRKLAEAELEASRKKISLMLEVAELANRSASVKEALRKTLDLICIRSHFPVGHVYWIDSKDPQVLTSSGIWHLEDERKFSDFRAVTSEFRFQVGVGLPGRVFKTQTPIWIENLEDDENFPRKKLMTSNVVRSAFALPILIGSNVKAVMEFFSDRSMPQDQSILEVARQVGIYIGQVYEREEAAVKIESARNLAEVAAQTKSMFLANISHEIRTPMNGIIGMTNLLLNNITDPVGIERIKIIQSCGNSLLDLINDTLDFSKLEADKTQLETHPFSIRSNTREIVELLTPRAQEKGVALSYRFEEGDPEWFFGDVTRFRQILTNLIGNSIKFTKVGNIEISSRAKHIRDKSWQIEFSVKDTGIGIPDHVKENLFQPFSQVDASTTRRFGGTGLGLAICKGLCEKMGGSIWVESEVGRGSTFFFTIAADLATPANEQLSDQVTAFDPKMGHKHPLRILVAEDNRTNQLVTVGLLERLGYKADIAANGLEVLGALRAQRYDLILMDCHMPEMDGFEATKQIVELYGAKRPKIVALTASSMKEDIEKCESVGMNGFLGKPITAMPLAKMLWSCQAGHLELGHEVSQKAKSICFDKDTFLANFQGMESLALETTRNFLTLLPDLISSIEAAIRSKSASDIERTAHSLKGAVSNFYAEPSRLLAWKLEQIGKENTNLGAQDVFEELKIEIEKLKGELNSLFDERKAA